MLCPEPPNPCDAPNHPAAHPRGIWAPLPAGSQDDGKVIHINRVQHRAVRVGLGEPVALPCLFLLQPSASLGPNEPPDPPRIKWSKVRSATGQREDVPILVAKDNVVKVVKAYEGRVLLPGYPRDRANATLLLRSARASDGGLYRCEVVAGIDDEQDLLPLEVTGEPGRWQGWESCGGVTGMVAGAPLGGVCLVHAVHSVQGVHPMHLVQPIQAVHPMQLVQPVQGVHTMYPVQGVHTMYPVQPVQGVHSMHLVQPVQAT